MTTLYLDRKGLELKLDGKALALYDGGKRARTVPLALLERVVIRAETLLSSTVLGVMAEAGCSTLVLSGRHGRRLAVVQGRAHNDAGLRVAQYAKAHDLAWRLSWARRFVGSKLTRQRRFLEQTLLVRADLRRPIQDALETIRRLGERVRDDVTSIGSLRGIEGAAQAAYFRAYVKLFPASLNFRGRNRRPPRDAVNACLSLAYTLVHFEAVRAAHAAGLDPFLGFYHELAFGRESLACDLIEPLRSLADAWVWEMFRSRRLRLEHFNLDKGACLLGKAGRFRYYESFEGFQHSTTRRLRGYCRLVARTLRAQAPTLPSEHTEDEP